MSPYHRSCTPAVSARPAARFPRVQPSSSSALGFPFNLESLFEAFQQPSQADFSPPLELRESEEAYILKAELPGLTREDIQLEVEDAVVTLKGTKAEPEEEAGDLRHQEQRFGRFERRIRLRHAVDPSQGKARFENGVLRVELPKLKAEEAGTRLEIEDA